MKNLKRNNAILYKGNVCRVNKTYYECSRDNDLLPAPACHRCAAYIVVFTDVKIDNNIPIHAPVNETEKIGQWYSWMLYIN